MLSRYRYKSSPVSWFEEHLVDLITRFTALMPFHNPRGISFYLVIKSCKLFWSTVQAFGDACFDVQDRWWWRWENTNTLNKYPIPNPTEKKPPGFYLPQITIAHIELDSYMRCSDYSPSAQMGKKFEESSTCDGGNLDDHTLDNLVNHCEWWLFGRGIGAIYKPATDGSTLFGY